MKKGRFVSKALFLLTQVNGLFQDLQQAFIVIIDGLISDKFTSAFSSGLWLPHLYEPSRKWF